jgi:Holliday junction resolvase RusA-like endonuclease
LKSKKIENLYRPVRIYFNPLTSGNKVIERKTKLRDLLKEAYGKDIEKIRKKSKNSQKLSIDVCFYLQKTNEIGRAKKDLDNLLKILCDVLPNYMTASKNEHEGLGLIEDDDQIFEIHCKKEIIDSEKDEGLELAISKIP